MDFRTCLIVDDSRIIRKVARRIVEGLGYEVDEAADGAEALAYCTGVMPDVLLIDWNMPVMDGISFLPLLRNPSSDWPERTLFFQWDSGQEPRRGHACDDDELRHDARVLGTDAVHQHAEEYTNECAREVGHRHHQPLFLRSEAEGGPDLRPEGAQDGPDHETDIKVQKRG